MFPVSIALAATWDPLLVHQVATVISDEARGIYNGWHQDPNLPGEKKGLIDRTAKQSRPFPVVGKGLSYTSL